MAAARYWRIVGISTYAGGDLAISKLRIQTAENQVLMDSVITSSHAPVSGTLLSLVDASAPETVRFARSDVRSAGFWIAFDLGADHAVFDLQVGAAANFGEFLQYCDVQYFGASGWVTAGTLGRFEYPGPFALTPLATPVADIYESSNTLLLPGGDYLDKSPSARTLTATGMVSNVTTPSGEVIKFDGGRLYGSASGLAFPGDFTVEFFAWSSETTTYGGVISTTTNGGASDGWVVELSSRGLAFAHAGANLILTPGSFVADGIPRHWAISRVGSSIRAFRDGSVIASTTYGAPLVAAALSVGAWASYGDYYLGKVRGLRVTAGVCRYAGNFTPPDVLQGYGYGGGVRQSYPSRLLRTQSGRAQITASAVPTVFSFASPSRCDLARDIEFGGSGTVYGTVKEKTTPANTPLRRRVYLMDQRSRLVVRETWSDAVTGEFEFRFVKEGIKWFVYSLDHEGHYAPTSADNQEAERMVLP